MSCSEGTRRLDADALLDTLVRRHGQARRERPDLAIELYHRAVLKVRVGLGRDRSTVTERSAADEGIALRATTGQGNELAFAASTGSRTEVVRWLLGRAGRLEMTVPSSPLWATRSDGPTVDRDAGPGLPSRDDAAGWLARALAEVEAPASQEGRPREAWLEVAHSVESWVADGPVHCSRTRTRGWALLHPASGQAGPSTGPIQVACRRWHDLPVDAWNSVVEDRRVSSRSVESPPTRAIPVLFDPESSARLVLALVKALHCDRSGLGAPVGPAWKVRDEPGRSDALLGGSFDDAGFPTQCTRLANGITACGVIEGEGHYRRPSFRDRPRPMPSHLVVEAEGMSPPSRCVLAAQAGLHIVAPDRWVIRIEGSLLERGLPGPRLRGCFLSIAPSDLVRRCVATVGPSRASHLGVETAALVFDGLSLQTP